MPEEGMVAAETDGAVSMAASAAPARVFSMPGHLLRRCNQIAVAIFLQECRAHDLTPLQFAVLAALAQHGAMDQVGLSGVAALDRTTVAVVVKKLMLRGLLARRQSIEDRRSKIVAITDAGATLLQTAQSSVDGAQERITAPLTAKERVELTRLLTKLAETNNDLSRAPQRNI